MLIQYSLLESCQENSKEEYWLAKHKYCPKCHQVGDVKIQHGQQVFSNIDVFDEYVKGLAKETKLLKRLVDGGIASEEEQNQLETNIELLSETKCPCCGKLMINKSES